LISGGISIHLHTNNTLKNALDTKQYIEQHKSDHFEDEEA